MFFRRRRLGYSLIRGEYARPAMFSCPTRRILLAGVEGGSVVSWDDLGRLWMSGCERQLIIPRAMGLSVARIDCVVQVREQGRP